MGGRPLEEYVASRLEQALARRPSQVRAMSDHASSADEARWNFAFWRQNSIEVIGGDDDSHGAAMLAAWIQHEAGLGFTEADDPEHVDELESQIEFAFFRKVADAVRLIHERGRALGPDGQPVPIVVHEVEYLPEIGALDERANPAGLLPEPFLALCRGEL